MKIVIPGGSGQVGTILARAFHSDGHEVVVLSRGEPDSEPWQFRRWDAVSRGDWAEEFEGADAVINLAGRSVNCRYSARNRREILESRVRSTALVGDAIRKAKRPPRVWLQASTATLYAHRYDAPNDEATGIVGGEELGVPDSWKFSIAVAKAWEKAVLDAGELPATRTVLLRSAMTMSPDEGGVFNTLLDLVRLGLGGTAGNGRQFVSWIHERDFVRAIQWLIEREDLAGAVNVSAPEPLPYAEFMREFRAAWGTRIGLPAPRWLLEIGAFLMRTETELVLKSRRVVPTRLVESGFAFEFPTWSAAVRDLCRQWRERNEGRSRAASR